MAGSWRPRALVIIFSLIVLGSATGASAGDALVFASWPAPGEVWARGWGASLSSTWFRVVSFEAEAARIPTLTPDGNMTSFTGSALLAPPISFLTPYGGLGIGLFRQTRGTLSDTGVLRAAMVGAKARLGLVVVRVEYRQIFFTGV